MFGHLQSLLLVSNIIFYLWMTLHVWLGCIFCGKNQRPYLVLHLPRDMFKIFVLYGLNFFDLIIVESSSPDNFNNFYISVVFSFSPLVIKLLNRMGLHNANTTTFLKWKEHYCTTQVAHLIYKWRLLTQPFIWSIDYQLLYMIFLHFIHSLVSILIILL